MAEGVFPFANTHCKGERPTRSAVCTSSALHSLRPCWTAFLSILQDCSSVVPHLRTTEFLASNVAFPQPAGTVMAGRDRADHAPHEEPVICSDLHTRGLADEPHATAD